MVFVSQAAAGRLLERASQALPGASRAQRQTGTLSRLNAILSAQQQRPHPRVPGGHAESHADADLADAGRFDHSVRQVERGEGGGTGRIR